MSYRPTLLEMVQGILRDLGSDIVNSIGDTQEAMDVAGIIKDTYYDMVFRDLIPERYGLLQVEGLGDTSRPNYLKLPAAVDKLEFIKYNKKQDGDTKDDYQDLKYMSPKDFLDMVSRRDSSLTEIDTVGDSSGVSLFVYNDRAPTYWTSFDDEYIVTDSFDNEVDASLQGAKTMCFGAKVPEFTENSDSFVPDLDDNLFPWLRNEAKAVASVVLKAAEDSSAARKARRMEVAYQNNRYRVTQADKNYWPNYGRK